MNSAQVVAMALRRRRFDDPMMVATLAKTAETVSLLAERAAASACRVLACTIPTVVDGLDAVVGWRVEDLVEVDGLDLAPEDLVEVDGLDLAPSHHPDHFTIALKLPVPKNSLPAPSRSWLLEPWTLQRRASTEVSISENLASPPQKQAFSLSSASAMF